MLKVKITRIDKDLPLPKFETSGSVAFDLIARLDTTIPPKQIIIVPSNNIVKVPEGYALVLVPRSSTPKKTGLLFPHSIGIIDQDYHGPEDVLGIQVYNFTEKEVTVKRGDRIAQGMFVRVDKFDWEEVESIDAPNRGGFGSTDKK